MPRHYFRGAFGDYSEIMALTVGQLIASVAIGTHAAVMLSP